MANLGEMHSPTIGSHAKRVAAYCKSMSRLQGMSDIETFQIEVAAVLHDIGKIGISSSILNKSESTMTRLDQEIYRKHVIHGEAILQMVPNVAEAPKYVRHHHERFDGNGYPDRLKGRDIPIGARMIAVVDAYDNVMNKRSFYQTATQEKALKYIRGRCPSQFDPDILKVFVECLEGAGSEAVREAEVEVNMRDITEGMVLSRDLRTAKGILSSCRRTRASSRTSSRRFAASTRSIPSWTVCSSIAGPAGRSVRRSPRQASPIQKSFNRRERGEIKGNKPLLGRNDASQSEALRRDLRETQEQREWPCVSLIAVSDKCRIKVGAVFHRPYCETICSVSSLGIGAP